MTDDLCAPVISLSRMARAYSSCFGSEGGPGRQVDVNKPPCPLLPCFINHTLAQTAARRDKYRTWNTYAAGRVGCKLVDGPWTTAGPTAAG